MDRRNFLTYATTVGLTTAFSGALSFAGKTMDKLGVNQNASDELSYHTLESIKFTSVKLTYPRLVGKNAVRGVHGYGPDPIIICTLTTNKGASGIGMPRGSQKRAEEIFAQLKGKKISELFAPESGVTDAAQMFDIPLHDLAGVILKKPVYQLLGSEYPITTKCYSGMIYMDDLDKDKQSGFDKIIEECQYDYKRGYRQLKLKIGRGHKWMSPEEGLRRDVEITQLVHRHFPDVEIMIDANDSYSVKDFIRYLEQIDNIPIWWIEEPFRETIEDFTILRKWLDDNRRRNTLLADGEYNADLNLALEMSRKGLFDVYLVDIMGYGFTNWRKLMPKLKENGLLASPHNWGDQIKTIYTAHLAAGLGNVATNEGVTCFSSDIDFGLGRLENGFYFPSDAPGFGMTLLK